MEKSKNRKFELEKFEVVRLKNLKSIKAGDGTGDQDTVTVTVNQSTNYCGGQDTTSKTTTDKTNKTLQ
ncbi:hypothetical protein LZZ90_11970 [Flavobacterium sp. SM15]|uniref:hypothetical protein n=1 Tax=Flavobacterium sp. SM15 TaxID=2908005 RepID=UPI001EDAB41A|nr:hypothetical protein [Flavobacterium sp. SM15]MCG2612224.1 hypothetical protein [Flavobacterium sp. SM15]